MQNIYLVGSKATFRDIPSRSFSQLNGSTKSDVVGPVALDKLDDLPKMSKEDKVRYLGTRRVRPGDRLSDSESEGHYHHQHDCGSTTHTINHD